MRAPKAINKLEKSAYHLVRRAGQYGADIYALHKRSKDLTPRQFAVLLTVTQNDSISQIGLVEKTGIDRSTLADLVKRLVDRGFLQRKRTKEDARANALRISANGRRALNASQVAAAHADAGILAALPAGRRKGFLQDLELISTALDELELKNGTKLSKPKKVRQPGKTKSKR
jgi:MarR family transcriptional regulator, temperature-dependent positive regulator of motility